MFTLHYKVTASTCDKDGRLKLYSALQMMQDCSEMWIDTEPAYKQYFQDNGMAQLLASRQLEIIRIPVYKEELTVRTTVFDIKPMFGFRNTAIYDADGNPCYKSWSVGAFVDMEEGRLKRLDDATIASLKMEPRLDMVYGDRRVIPPKTGGTVLDPVKVQRSDIDYNRHVNNANYVRIAMESLPENFEVRGMRMEYRIAAKMGDVFTPELWQSGDGIIVSLSIHSGVSAIFEFTR